MMKGRVVFAVLMAICVLAASGCSKGNESLNATVPVSDENPVPTEPVTAEQDTAEQDAAEQGAAEQITEEAATEAKEPEYQEKMKAPSDNTEKIPVTVTSDGESFIPVENMTFSETTVIDDSGEAQTAAGCGPWLKPQEVKGMPRVPYSDDLKVEVHRPWSQIVYGFYDENNEPLEEYQEAEGPDQIVFPSRETEYSVKLDVTYEYETGRWGCQYFFKVVPGGHTPALTVTSEIDNKKADIPSGKGSGVFPMLVQKDRLPYVPIGSRLELGFSDGEIPVSVALSDMILDESGNHRFADEDVKKSDLVDDSGRYSIYIDTNLNAMRYRYAEAYRPGGIIRGYLMDCRFEDGREETYAVAVKTDAAFGIREENSSVYLMPICGTGIEVFTDCRLQNDDKGLELIFSMNSNTNRDFRYGEEFKLERFDGPDLKEIPFPERIGWNDLEYTLKAKKSAEHQVNLEQFYGELEPGYYRFSKSLSDKRTGEILAVFADFVIN